MTLIDCFNIFQNVAKSLKLSANARSLYIAILGEFNSARYPDALNLSNRLLQDISGIDSERSFHSARNALMNSKLILQKKQVYRLTPNDALEKMNQHFDALLQKSCSKVAAPLQTPCSEIAETLQPACSQLAEPLQFPKSIPIPKNKEVEIELELELEKKIATTAATARAREEEKYTAYGLTKEDLEAEAKAEMEYELEAAFGSDCNKVVNLAEGIDVSRRFLSVPSKEVQQTWLHCEGEPFKGSFAFELHYLEKKYGTQVLCNAICTASRENKYDKLTFSFVKAVLERQLKGGKENDRPTAQNFNTGTSSVGAGYKIDVCPDA